LWLVGVGVWCGSEEGEGGGGGGGGVKRGGGGGGGGGGLKKSLYSPDFFGGVFDSRSSFRNLHDNSTY